MKTSVTPLPPDLLSATETFATNLASAEPFVIYYQAQLHLSQDQQAYTLLENLSIAQAEIRKKQARGLITQFDVDNLRALQFQAKSNPVIMDFAQTQKAAIAYLREINQGISQLLGVDFASLAKKSGCC